MDPHGAGQCSPTQLDHTDSFTAESPPVPCLLLRVIRALLVNVSARRRAVGMTCDGCGSHLTYVAIARLSSLFVVRVDGCPCTAASRRASPVDSSLRRNGRMRTCVVAFASRRGVLCRVSCRGTYMVRVRLGGGF